MTLPARPPAALLAAGCDKPARAWRYRPYDADGGPTDADAFPDGAPDTPADHHRPRPLPPGSPKRRPSNCGGDPAGRRGARGTAARPAWSPVRPAPGSVTGPICAGTWQWTVVQMPNAEPLQVVTRGAPGSLRLVTAGTDVCSIPVRTGAPAGIRAAACDARPPAAVGSSYAGNAADPLRLPRPRGHLRRAGAAHPPRRRARHPYARRAASPRRSTPSGPATPTRPSCRWRTRSAAPSAVTLDELAAGDPLVITREVVLPVEFVLAARAGDRAGRDPHRRGPPAGVRAVPRLAARPPARRRRGRRALQRGGRRSAPPRGEYDAAICAPIGAARHRLTVLAEKIADHADAVTRFALVSRPGPPPPPTGDDVTSLAVYIAHDRVGALLAVLTELAVRGVNLTRIESRPTGERAGPLRVLPGLHRARRRAAAGRGAAGPAPGLRRRALPRLLPPAPAGPAAPRRAPGARHRAGLVRRATYADSAAWLARLRAGELT